MELQVTDKFKQTFTDVHGEKGQRWLEYLPQFLEDCAKEWKLELLPSSFPLSYNYVHFVRQEGGDLAVLKCSLPNKELNMEIEALSFYAGKGIVKLLAADQLKGVMLLEYLNPGEPLSSVTDLEQATAIAATILNEIWVNEPRKHTLVRLTNWFGGGLKILRTANNGGTGILPEDIVVKAEQTYGWLINSEYTSVILHGDMHLGNILSTNRGGKLSWLAIDPKGIVGDPAYDLGVYLKDVLLSHRLSEQRLKQLITLACEITKLEAKRVAGWILAHAVLSAWWCIEDHGSGWEEPIQCARFVQTYIENEGFQYK